MNNKVDYWIDERRNGLKDWIDRWMNESIKGRKEKDEVLYMSIYIDS